MTIIARVCRLERTVAGNPKMNQFPAGMIDSGSVLPNGFSIGYGGVNPRWPGGGLRGRILAWHHSNINATYGLYAVYFGPGPGGSHIDWIEAAPRYGQKAREYCETVDHLWRVFRWSGYSDYPTNSIWVQERVITFAEVHYPSDVTPETPLIVDTFEMHEILPSIPRTLTGFNLPKYTSQVSDPTNGEELD